MANFALLPVIEPTDHQTVAAIQTLFATGTRYQAPSFATVAS
jgi:hypothetical protein